MATTTTDDLMGKLTKIAVALLGLVVLLLSVSWTILETAIQDWLGRGGGPPSGGGGGMSGGGRGGMGGGGRGGMGGGGGQSGPPGDRDEMKKRLDPEIQWLKITLSPDQ